MFEVRATGPDGKAITHQMTRTEADRMMRNSLALTVLASMEIEGEGVSPEAAAAFLDNPPPIPASIIPTRD
jgi:hypothetical protein